MAVATIGDTRDRMKALLDGYIATLAAPGGMTAHRYLPRGLNAAELPAFMCLPGEATHTQVSTDEEETSRIWRLRLFIAPTAQGIEAEVEERAEAYLEAVQQYLNRFPHLELNGVPLAGVRRAWVESDAGLREGRYPDAEDSPYYLFIEWRWRTVTRRNRR